MQIQITSKYSIVCYVDSIYALALCIFINNQKAENILFIISEKTFNQKLFQNLDNFIVIPDKLKKLTTIEKILYIKGYIPKRFKSLLSHIEPEMEIFGHDHLRHSFLFLTRGMTLLEDGQLNYNKFFIEKNNITFSPKAFLYKILGIYYNKAGYDKRIKSIFLSRSQGFDYTLKNKVKIFNKMDFYKSLNNILNGCLSFKLCEKEETVILMTQPLSEDKITTEREKIDIYKTIIINLNCKTLIKPHPRDLTNYEYHFQDLDIEVIPKTVLAEALILNNLQQIKSIVSICSSTNFHLQGIKGFEIITLGTEFNEKIETKIGKIPSNNTKYSYLVSRA